MKYRIRQRFFSWFDSFDIYDEDGNTAFTVEGKLSWGHCLHILDDHGNHIATVQEKVLTFLPKFEFYIRGEYVGMMKKEFTFAYPQYNLDFNGWHVSGDFMGWNYSILDQNGYEIARVTKQLLHLTDNYVIDVAQNEDVLNALMIVIAIDAERCTASKSS